MEHHTSKEEKAIGAEVKEAPFVDTVPETAEYSNILERKNMSKREFYWLWAGYDIFFSHSSPPFCLFAPTAILQENRPYIHPYNIKLLALQLLLCISFVLPSDSPLSFSLSKQTNIVFSSKPSASRSRHV